MKTCRKCGESKPLDDYHNDAKSKDGKRADCKACKNRQNKAYQHGAGRCVANACKARYKIAHPKKKRAHELVNKAIAAGKLQRGPCEVCGEVKAVAHHDDYDHPLVIRWLCEPHHKEWHCANGEALNPD